MENKIFTIENVPKELDRNQFYCFNKTNGQILLGEILGKTLDGRYYFIKVKSKIHKVSLGFTKEDRVLISSSYRCFNNYSDLKSYDETYKLKKLDKTRKRKNYKHCVNKYSYCYIFTNPDNLFSKSHFKIFDTKKEAEEYSSKGLKKIEKYSLIFTDKLNNLLKEIEEKQKLINTKFTLSDLIIRDPNELKIGNYLLKIENSEVIGKDWPYTLIKEIKSEFKLKVEEVISNRLIRLNDDIILEDYDIKYNYTLFREEDIEKVKLAIKYSNLETIRSMVKKRLTYLKELESYCKLYKNRTLSEDNQKYFYKISYEKVIEAVNNFLTTY